MNRTLRDTIESINESLKLRIKQLQTHEEEYAAAKNWEAAMKADIAKRNLEIVQRRIQDALTDY